MLTFEAEQGRQIFRHKDIKRLLEFAGVNEQCDYTPVMSQEFHLHCNSEADAATVAAKLESLALEDGSQVMWAYPIGSKVDSGCKLNRDPGESLVTARAPNSALPFNELFYPLESLRSGMHSREGLLWIKASGQTSAVSSTMVPLLSVYPTLAHLLGLHSELGSAASLIANLEDLQRESVAA